MPNPPQLLILRILKIPVLAIRQTFRIVSMLTYLPNYLLIYILDSILFTYPSTFKMYLMTWPIRLLSLLMIVLTFIGQSLCIYYLIGISHLQWYIQLILTLILTQCMLGLMRKGYLDMLKYYQPTKLKSPYQHIRQGYIFVIDIIGLLLACVNIVLVVNSYRTFGYQYKCDVQHNYLMYICRLINQSIVKIIRLWYIGVFFRAFPWRYHHHLQQQQQHKQQQQQQQLSILQLYVLYTLLMIQTCMDILCYIILGVYCYYLHPRRHTYRQHIKQTHNKYKCTLWFSVSTFNQIAQIICIVCICMPFQYKYSRQLMYIICGYNDYSVSYWVEIVGVGGLAILRVPTFMCKLVIMLSIYKYMNYLEVMDARLTNGVQFSNKVQVAPTTINNGNGGKQNKVIWSDTQQIILIKLFAQFLKQLPYLLLMVFGCVMKPWTYHCIKHCINNNNNNYEIHPQICINYFRNACMDYLFLMPSLLGFGVVVLFTPWKIRSLFGKVKQKQNFMIYAPKQILYRNAYMPKLFTVLSKQIKSKVFLYPILWIWRVTGLQIILGKREPEGVVVFVQRMLCTFYRLRVSRSKYYKEYLDFYKADSAAGMLNTNRSKLKFWKFAHKSIRHRIVSSILSYLMPKKYVIKAKTAAKVHTNYSALSNHYWNCYNTTWSMLQFEMYFIVNILLTLVGVLIFFPLTLWRMPTFAILFKQNKFKRSYFFKILIAVYRQMAIDFMLFFVRLITFLLFPRSYIYFVFKTAFRYPQEDLKKFVILQNNKKQFMIQNILVKGLVYYRQMTKVVFVKFFWVRKKQLNTRIHQQNIKLRDLFFAFIKKPVEIPQITKFHDPELFSKKNKNNNENYIGLSKLFNSQHSGQKQQIDTIIDSCASKTVSDIPYLCLMCFLLFTLPWRVFYIKQALFFMRDDFRRRNQLIKLFKIISSDYQCLFLYIVLLFTIVKTKRAFTLFIRNFKLNFYVGTLKYSHLQQLRAQVKQAFTFYYSCFLIYLSCIIAPYEMHTTLRTVYVMYRQIRQNRIQKQKNEQMIANTIKQGKSLQLITVISNNTLMQIFRFLDAKDLTKMMGTCRYIYESVKDNQILWVDYWTQVYSQKYPNFKVKAIGQQNVLDYQKMCVVKYQEQRVGTEDNRNQFGALAERTIKHCALQTRLDLKLIARTCLNERQFNYIFRWLRYTPMDGFGPENNWPRPDDDPQNLAAFQIQRRQVIQLSEGQFFQYWLGAIPMQFIMRRIERFFDENTHRKKKQLLFLFFIISGPLFLLFIIYMGWSWFWTLDSLIGCKFVGLGYSAFWIGFFIHKISLQYRNWTSIIPFDIWFIFVDFLTELKNKGIRAKNTLKRKVQIYIVRPIKKVCNLIVKTIKWVFKKVKKGTQLFVQKVAKPLYISISNKIVATAQIIQAIFKAFVKTMKSFLKFLKKLIISTFKALQQLVKNISKLYSNFLEKTLRFALSFGIVGELIFTILVLIGMISPSLVCYFVFWQRWFIICSTLMTMVMMATGYRHLTKIKQRLHITN